MQLTHPAEPRQTDATPRVQVVVSCTNSKRHEPEPTLRVRDLPELPVRRRVAEWISRLQAATGERTLARDLYAGDHWATAVALTDIAVRHDYAADLWVLSAGYGLIPANLPIVSYAATFTTSSADCVGTGPEVLDWWDALASTTSIAPGRPRSLVELADADPTSRIIVAAALPYLHPIAEDATRAARRLESPDHLLVVSAGARKTTTGLTPFLVPVDSRISQLVGGSNISLNARTAAFILETAGETGLGRISVSRYLAAHLDSLPSPVVYDRMPLTDDEVMGYINERLAEDPALSATRMLRDLRDAGRACEQQRFHELVQEVRESHA